MKILSLISSFLQGGAQNVLVDTVTNLVEHEHRVIHFTGRKGIGPHVPYVDALARAGVACIDTPWGSLDTEQGRRQVLRGFQPDVVLCHWWGHDPWLPWVRQSASRRGDRGPAFVCVMHHYGIPAARGYDRYVLVTRAQLKQCRAQADWRVRVIHNGVELGRFAEFSRVRQPGKELVVGRLSMLRPEKIPHDWIQTLDSFRLAGTRHVIGGSGEVRARLLEAARNSSQPSRFSIPGNVARERVPEFLSGLDVFCYITSEAIECSPLALIEAQASGLPIVAEAKGGIPEIVTHGENGLLVESVSDLERALRRLKREPGRVERLSRGALESAGRFSMDRQMHAYRELLDDLVQDAEEKACA